MTSAIASAEGWKQRRAFAGFLCRDFAMSIGSLAKVGEPGMPPLVQIPARARHCADSRVRIQQGVGLPVPML